MKQRVYQIEINDKVIIAENSSGVQARAQFDITVNAVGNITLCDLNLSNLAESTISTAFKRGAVLAIRAGYEDNIDYVFRGIIRQVFRGRSGATTYTNILARGGNLEKNAINRALGENAKLSEILQELADALGYKLNITKSEFADVYPTGYSITQDPMKLLRDLAYSWNFYWSIENDSLVIFKVENGRKAPKKIINMQNGLEGIPEVTDVGVNFSVRMDPSIKIGSRIELDTKYKSFNFSGVYYNNQLQDAAGSGSYTVMEIVHSGDNYGQSWTTRVTSYRYPQNLEIY
jgi:hypothetical protein